MNQRWYWTLDMCILIRDYQCLHYVLIKIMIKYKYKQIYIIPPFGLKTITVQQKESI